MKYIKVFQSAQDAEQQLAQITHPTLSAVRGGGFIGLRSGVDPFQKNNEIWYTSSNDNIVTPNATDVFGANIISNTYSNGKGIIVFDANINSIGNSAFNNCSTLASISIPNSVTSIGNSAFYGCTGLSSIDIPNSVTSIGDSAFKGSGLTSFIVPEGVTSIGIYALNNCLELLSISISSTVTTLNGTICAGCNKLETITVNPNNSVFTSGNNCNAIMRDNQLIAGCKNTIIPNNINAIGFSAFQDCTGLTSITLPSSLRQFDRSAFYGCTGLTSITIPANVTVINNNVFQNCTGLTSITCLPTTPPSILGYTFSNTNDCPIYVPSASVETYKSKTNWSKLSSRIRAIS